MTVTLVALSLSILIGHKVILSPGIVILAENLEVYSLKSLAENYAPYWQEKFQYFDFGIGDSVYLYGVVTTIGQLLGLSYAFVQRLLLLAPHGIAFLAMYFLLRYILLNAPDKPNIKTTRAIAFIGSVVYTLNPWIATQPRDVALRFDYALAPLIILFFFRVFEQRNKHFRRVALFSLLLSFVADFRFVLIILPTLLLYFVIPKERSDDTPFPKRRFSTVILLFAFFSILSMGKFLSPILYSLHTSKIPYADSFHEDMVGGASILELLSTKTVNSPARRALDETSADASYRFFLPISFFSLLYMVLLRRRPGKHEMLFPLIMIITIPIATLRHEPFETFNMWLLTKAPLSQLYGRLLRFSDWNALPLLISVSVMVPLTVREILGRVSKQARGTYLYLQFFTIAAFCGISSWTLFTGDMNGYWKPSNIPDEFKKANNQFSKERDNFHVLWLPTYWEKKAFWAKNTGPHETTAPTCNFDIRSSFKPSYLTERFYLFDYYSLLGPRPGFRPLEGYAGKNIARIYKNLNIRYAVIHSDVDLGETSPMRGFENLKGEDVIDSLKSSGGFESVVVDNCLATIMMSHSSQEYRATWPFVVLGGLPTQGAVIDAEVEQENASLVYVESAHFAWNDLQRLVQASPTLLIKGESDVILPLILSSIDKRHLCVPYEHTLRHDPLQTWSRGYVQTGVADPRFQETLRVLDLGNWAWDFDYGDGLVFTIMPDAKLAFPINIEQAGDHILLVRYLANAKGGSIGIDIGDRNFLIPTKASCNYFKCDSLSIARLSKGKHPIEIKNISGFNAVNILALIPVHQFAKRKRELEASLDGKSCVYLLEAETDFEVENTNVCREKEASNGRVLVLDRNSSAKCHMNILEEGDYCLQFRLCGGIEVAIDSTLVELHSDSLGFSSCPIQHLNKGEHQVRIVPTEYPSSLDVAWMGPAEKGKIPKEWLAVKDSPSDLSDVVKINSSTMKLHAKAKEAFLLSVAEGYDPLIAAFSDGKKHDSFPVFGLINGFLIDEQGDVDVIVKFLPQFWAKIGIWISLIFALLLIVCVLFEPLHEAFNRKPSEDGVSLTKAD